MPSKWNGITKKLHLVKGKHICFKPQLNIFEDFFCGKQDVHVNQDATNEKPQNCGLAVRLLPSWWLVHNFSNVCL